MAHFCSSDRKQWIPIVRGGFWIFGIAAGGLVTYTTRFFLNTDGVNYLDLGDAFGQDGWSGLVNLTLSPGYAFLLETARNILHTSPVDEVAELKLVNFFGFILGMAACEIFVRSVDRYISTFEHDRERFLPFPERWVLIYGAFLIAALTWTKVRTVAPELFVFALIILATATILRIRVNPEGYSNTVLLGVFMGIGYLIKTFFLPFSLVFVFLAGLCSGSLKRAVAVMVAAMGIMLLIGSPLMVGLTGKLGHFSYGEAGNFNYAKLVSGTGTPLHPPLELHEHPKVLCFKDGPGGTYPGGFDLAYWSQGFRPVFDLSTQFRILVRNLWRLLSQSLWFFALIFIWFVAQSIIGSLRVAPVLPPSIVLLLGLPAMAGVCLFCLIEMEIRYCAPFLFLGMVALITSPRYGFDHGNTFRIATRSAWGLAAVMLIFCMSSVVDESVRGLHSTQAKLSYRDRFFELVKVKEFLRKNGIQKGDRIAIVGSPHIYWARMAGVTIIASVPDTADFLSVDPVQRKEAVKSLGRIHAKAVVAKDPGLKNLEKEGWSPIPGARDYFVLLTEDLFPFREDIVTRSSQHPGIALEGLQDVCSPSPAVRTDPADPNFGCGSSRFVLPPGESAKEKELLMISDDVTLGENVVIFHPDLVNIYGCEIGDGCRIGAFVEIRKEVRIGRNVKIQAFAFIPEGIVVEDGVFIGPHVVFTNDKYPRAVNQDGTPMKEGEWERMTTLVKQGASIGANATILCGITVGEHAMVAAGSVVTEDVPSYKMVSGVPARVQGDVPDLNRR